MLLAIRPEGEIHLHVAVIQDGVDKSGRDRVELHDVVLVLPGAGGWAVGQKKLLCVILTGLCASFRQVSSGLLE